MTGKRKVRVDQGPCEMGIGYDSSRPDIVIVKCGKPGVGRPDMLNFGPPIACDDCYARWRNRSSEPRRLHRLERPDQRYEDPGE